MLQSCAKRPEHRTEGIAQLKKRRSFSVRILLQKRARRKLSSQCLWMSILSYPEVDGHNPRKAAPVFFEVVDGLAKG